MKQLKKKCVAWLMHRQKARWETVNRLRILIQTNMYFNEKSWNKSFDILLHDDLDKLEVKYTCNQLEFTKLLHDADAAYCFGLSTHYNLTDSRPRVLYFGVSGEDHHGVLDIPENMQLFSCRGISKEAIAEYCLMTALMLNVGFHDVIYNNCRKCWDQKNILDAPYATLAKKRIGIFGVGANGLAIAAIFKKHGCHISGYDLVFKENNIDVDRWYSSMQLAEMLSEIDIAIISLPLTVDTKNLFNKDKLDLMNENAILINVARGDIIVEKDLYDILKEGRIKAAALDTLWREPLNQTSRWWKLSNVIVSPHIAGNVNLFVNEIQNDFIEKILPLIQH